MPVTRPSVQIPASWRSSTLPATQNWSAVGWAGEQNWAALSISTSTGGYTTNNGVTWATASIPVASSQWNGIAADVSNNILVACNATSPGTAFIRSTNGGQTWSAVAVPSPATGGFYNNIAFGGGNFVAVAGASTAVKVSAYSSDGGNTWSTATMPSSLVWNGACYDGSKFYAVGFLAGALATTAYATSSDGGATWAAGTFASSLPWVAIAAGNGTLVATADNRTQYNYSTNGGSSWTSATMPVSGAYGLWFSGGVFMAMNISGTSSAWSRDGINWNTVTLPSSKVWVRVQGNNGGNFMSVSWNGADTVAAFMPINGAHRTNNTSTTRAAVF